MNHKIFAIALGLGMLTLAPHTLRAQRADTLRRSLTVLTSEAIKLEPKQPTQLTLSPPVPFKAKLVTLEPVALAHRADVLRPDPLASMAQLPRMLAKSDQLGYIDGAVGLKYNGRIALGLRPINSLEQQLDLFLSSRLTRYAFANDIYAGKIRELGIALGGSYRQAMGASSLGIDASYRYDRGNYYGLYTSAGVADRLALSPETASSLTDTPLIANRVNVGVRVTSTEPLDNGWEYAVAPRLKVTIAKGANVAMIGKQYSEISPSVDLTLFKAIGTDGMAVGIDLGAEAHIHSDAGAEYTGGVFSSSYTSYTNKSILSIAPYWRISGGSRDHLLYGLVIGARGYLYRQLQSSGMHLAPNVSGYMHWGNAWQLQLDVVGNVRANSLEQMLGEMPYLHIGPDTRITRIPISVRLGLSGRIAPNLTLELSGQYQRLRDALSYVALAHATDYPTPLSTPLSPAPSTAHYALGFAPAHADGTIFSIGSALSYRQDGLWSMRVGADYHSHSASLTGRPSIVLSAVWQCHPTDTWDLSLGYEMQAGIKYGLLTYETSAPASAPTQTLKPLNVLKGTATYRLGDRWSITGQGQFVLSSSSQLYLGYQPQRVAFSLGASYRF